MTERWSLPPTASLLRSTKMQLDAPLYFCLGRKVSELVSPDVQTTAGDAKVNGRWGSEVSWARREHCLRFKPFRRWRE